MSAHPNRAGAISAVLFAAFSTYLQSDHGDEGPALSIGDLRNRILNAALAVAVERASRKYRWPRDYLPVLCIDETCVYNSGCGPSGRLGNTELEWLTIECRKIARNALAALEQGS